MAVWKMFRLLRLDTFLYLKSTILRRETCYFIHIILLLLLLLVFRSIIGIHVSANNSNKNNGETSCKCQLPAAVPPRSPSLSPQLCSSVSAASSCGQNSVHLLRLPGVPKVFNFQVMVDKEDEKFSKWKSNLR